jgi:PAS domain S-box-containing protein
MTASAAPAGRRTLPLQSPQHRSPESSPDAREADGAIMSLSTAPAGRGERRLAAAVVALSIVVFGAAAPVARLPLPPLPAFIPSYQSALVISDLLTAIMLFGQFGIVRSRALLVLAGGYLFAGLIAVAHALTFPGLFSPGGLLGAGPQSTAWLYMLWHSVFPIAVIAYALLKRRDRGRAAVRPVRAAVVATAAAALGLVCALTLLATAAEPLLPAIMDGNRYTPVMIGIVSTVWVLSLFGFASLWLGRPFAVLDLWLMVVMCAWLCDVALSAVLNAGRFDLGFYAGRIYGLLAASFVLGLMLIETSRLYDRLAVAAARLTDHAGALETRVQDRTRELDRINRALQRNNALLAAIFRSSPIGIYLLDPEGRVVLWNPSAERIFGYSEIEALGRIPPFVRPELLGEFRANFARMSHGESAVGFEVRRQRKDGTPIDINVAWATLRNADGEFGGIVHAVMDITERRQIEAELRQVQKMEAVGQLTGGIAHDFNNLLGVVIGNLDLLEERIVADPESTELLREALHAALRGAELTRQLLAVARRQPLQPKVVETDRVVTGISQLLARAIGGQIKIVLQLPDGVWPVLIDPAQLEAAMLNLAVNARDAMPDGGTLTIEAANLSLDAEEAGALIELAAGDYVVLAVSDTGTGMPPEVIARVFEPFYTTKPVGQGTGLGLSMVYGFAKQSGGAVKIYSEPGVGTTIRLYLPRAVGAVSDAPAPPSVSALPTGSETILVVEDNATLRKVAVRQLHELGYTTLEADNAAAALAVIDSGQPIDLMFTDIAMPGGADGRSLARQAAALRPGLKVLFTTGFTMAAADAVGPAAFADRLLSKPYRKTELAQRVRAALDT